ncbi:hypothetical protein A3730_02850 [Alcanivorax sp. HI0044]|uniref:hypothetical protein n=1 Tax=Alcanivorax sp. HI0044 TaxID=1822234 RepID=UPI0007B9DE4E|nr:hypothetical protein [Alcanivorax sp. HI0044]KZY35100.1 hypothetical protein A3730_02850 [Alcanivorax sp. HI0044]
MKINSIWLWFFCALTLSLVFSLVGADNLAIISFFFGVFAITKISSERNLFHLMWLLGLYVFVCCPLVIFIVVGYEFVIEPAIIVLLLSAFAIGATGKRDFSSLGERKSDVFLLWFALFCVITILLGLAFGKSAYFFLYPGLVVAFSFSLRGVSLYKGTAALVMLACVFLSYCFFVWGGFGRLVIASWMLVPLLIYIFSYDLYFNKWLFLVSAAVASLFMSMLRFSGADASNILHYVMKDSTTSPYRLVDQIVNEYPGMGAALGLQGVIDQFVLFFAGAFPRNLWESKPLGFGFLYTVDNLSVSLIDAGHSVAALFVGEHIYYVGFSGGVLFAFLATFLVCALYRVTYRLSTVSHILSIPVAMYVTSFFWAGIATYSQRLQQGLFLILAAWLVVFFLKRVLGK